MLNLFISNLKFIPKTERVSCLIYLKNIIFLHEMKYQYFKEGCNILSPLYVLIANI